MKYSPVSPDMIADPWAWNLFRCKNTAGQQTYPRQMWKVFFLPDDVATWQKLSLAQRFCQMTLCFFFAGCLCIGTLTASTQWPYSNEWSGCFFRVLLFVWTQIKRDLTLPLWSTKISLLTNLSMFPCWPSKGSRISWTAVSSSRLRQEKADDILLTQRWTRILPQPIWNHLHAVQLQPPLRRWRGQLQKGYIGCSLRSLCCLWHTWCSFSSSTTTEDFSALVDKFVSTKSE